MEKMGLEDILDTMEEERVWRWSIRSSLRMGLEDILDTMEEERVWRWSIRSSLRTLSETMASYIGQNGTYYYIYIYRSFDQRLTSESFIHRFYIALFSALEQTHCAAWLVPRGTAAVSAQVLCTPFNHAPVYSFT